VERLLASFAILLAEVVRDPEQPLSTLGALSSL
jgi:hypothetical protein